MTFRLSLLGKQELQGIFEEESFSAFVAGVDEIGAWLILDGTDQRETVPSFLLKWDYVATASMEVSLKGSDPESSKKQIGFGNL